MASMNVIYLKGNATKAAELKYTATGKAIAKFTLACNRRYSVKGEDRQDAQFIPVVAWGKWAEACGQQIQKGSSVFVCGRLQIREYEVDGQKRRSAEVVADEIGFLKSRDEQAVDAPGSQGTLGDTFEPPAS